MKEELIALGKVLQCDFENLVNQQVPGWLTNDFLMNADLQPLTELEAALSTFWEMNDEFAFLETSLTSGFIPGESSEDLGTSSSPSELGGEKGKAEGGKVLNPLPFSLSPFPSPHPASLGWQTTSETGLREDFPPQATANPEGNWGLGIGDFPLGGDKGRLGIGIFTQQGVRPATVNRSQQFEVKNQTQSPRRSPSQLPELTNVSESPTLKNQTQAEKRSPLGLKELAAIVDSSTPTHHEEVKNQTQSQRRSPSQLPELTNVSESPTVKNQTQAEKRSPLGLKELANFLASEPYSNDSESVNSQAAPAIKTSRQPDTLSRPSLNFAIETASTTAFSSQDSGYWEGIEAQNRVVRSNLISKSLIEADDSSFESDGVVGYPASSQTVQHLKPFTSQQISKGNVLSESSFSQEQQENYSQENPTTKHETNFFSQPLEQEIEIDLIVEAIAKEINREYRRFYGC
ncbi:hypothetical protein [Nostoc sp.]|uniref:hypothetical protein n=1 Tax=Nostoc sp. TaxID=1180 RepID=UPI002FFB2892